MKRLFTVLLVSAAMRVEAASVSAQVPLIGHSLTPTSYTLGEGQYTAGTFALGYGLTRYLSISTSPWLIAFYNMPMLSAKFAMPSDNGLFRYGVEVLYFKTLPYRPLLSELTRRFYNQESVFARLLGSARVMPRYTLHLSAGVQYFLDKSSTYSLHLADSDLTLSLSSLHEVGFTDSSGLFLEAGMLGLEYAVPYLHFGASLFVRWPWGFLQAGASVSTRTVDDGRVYRTYVVHPEVQLQTFF